MTNLDSLFKSRDIILSTKVHLGKAMVFPVVMYGCESWTIKTQRDQVEREVGVGNGMGNTCKSMADSCQCMVKTSTIL